MMRVTGLFFWGYMLVFALTDFSTIEAQNNKQISVPGLVTITASTTGTPPAWAIMERHLIKTMEETAQIYLDHFARPDGTIYGGSSNDNSEAVMSGIAKGVRGAPNYDDLYEMFFNWPLFYAIGADNQILLDAIKEYNAITRMCTTKPHNKIHQLYNEFPENADWFHISEGMQLFYNLGLAEPSLPVNIQRAKRFAGMYMDEDSSAVNYDPKYKVIKSPFTGSKGPLSETRVSRYSLDPQYGWATLYPVIKNLEQDWDNNKKRAVEVEKLYNRVVVPCDTPSNLSATALITNAYLYTGDEKYKKWVLEYVDAWMERIKQNGGILPDNIGRTGKIGEYRQGQWWGGHYGWTSRYSLHMMFGALSIAAECATMLSGDIKYLDILRSQIDVLLDNSTTTAEGQLLVPYYYSPNGWTSFRPMIIRDLSHLWHASMDSEDWNRIERVMKGNKFYPLPYSRLYLNEEWKHEEPFDWNFVPNIGDRDDNNAAEHPRLTYYAGKNPDWPLHVLQADYREVLRRLELVQAYSIPPKNITQNDWLYHKSPVLTKGLLQVTMGAPQTIYNGGLLRARVRYYDSDLVRPGLPPDVAALVEELKNDLTVVTIVNLSVNNTRHLIVQAGAFGEDEFTDIRYTEKQSEKTVPVNGKYVSIEMPPATTIKLFLGTKRFVNKPSYAFPWHTPEAK